MTCVKENSRSKQGCSTCVSFRFFTVLVVERDREVVGNWLITKTTFPPLNVTCPVRAQWGTVGLLKVK